MARSRPARCPFLPKVIRYLPRHRQHLRRPEKSTSDPPPPRSEHTHHPPPQPALHDPDHPLIAPTALVQVISVVIPHQQMNPLPPKRPVTPGHRQLKARPNQTADTNPLRRDPLRRIADQTAAESPHTCRTRCPQTGLPRRPLLPARQVPALKPTRSHSPAARSSSPRRQSESTARRAPHARKNCPVINCR